jgi:hypothetical protein
MWDAIEAHRDRLASKTEFTFAELQTVTSLARGEIRECINRGIISAPAGVGQGHHRSYNKWNLVEGVIAAALLRQVRAGAVALIMKNLRAMLDDKQIDRVAAARRRAGLFMRRFFLLERTPTKRRI